MMRLREEDGSLAIEVLRARGIEFIRGHAVHLTEPLEGLRFLDLPKWTAQTMRLVNCAR